MTAEVLRHFALEIAHDKPRMLHIADSFAQTGVLCRLKGKTEDVS